MFVHCDCHYWYRPFSKTLEQAKDASGEEDVPEAAVIFVHAEAQDEQRRSKVLIKAIKNIKGLANKRGLKNIVLHSFTHLSNSTASPEFAHDFLEEVTGRLRRTGHNVWLPPSVTSASGSCRCMGSRWPKCSRRFKGTNNPSEKCSSPRPRSGRPPATGAGADFERFYRWRPAEGGLLAFSQPDPQTE